MYKIRHPNDRTIVIENHVPQLFVIPPENESVKAAKNRVEPSVKDEKTQKKSPHEN